MTYLLFFLASPPANYDKEVIGSLAIAHSSPAPILAVADAISLSRPPGGSQGKNYIAGVRTIHHLQPFPQELANEQIQNLHDAGNDGRIGGLCNYSLLPCASNQKCCNLKRVSS